MCQIESPNNYQVRTTTLCRFAVAILFATLTSFAAAQLPKSWKSVGIGGGGAFFAPTFNPFNEDEMWLACDMTGLYHSTNAGVSWTTVPFGTIQTGANAPQVQYTSNKNILYNVDTSNNAMTPVKSTNGGVTWNALSNDPTGQGAWYLLADSSTATRLFLSSYSTLYFSDNSGDSWSTVVSGNNDSGVVVAGAYFNGETIVVATSLGVFKSTNGGTSFSSLSMTGIGSGEQIVSFAAGKSGSTTRFFVVTLQPGQAYGGMGGDNYASYAGVYSLNYGSSASWTKCVNGIPSSDGPFFVGMALNDVEDVYLAGSCDAGVPIILKSTNGGASWQSVLNTGADQNVLTGWQGFGGVHSWSYDQLVFGFEVCPTDAKRAAFTGYGFCHMTTNGGTTWQQVYVNPAYQNPAGHSTPTNKSYGGNGLENTSCWWLTWPTSSIVWACFTDIQAIRSTDAGNTWNFNYTGENVNTSYQVAVATNGTMYRATSSVHDMYQSTHLTDGSIDGGTGNVLVSTNQGATWTQLGTINHVVMGVALDPTNVKRMYATVASSAAGGVYVCQDITKGTSAVWTRLAAPPRTQGHAFNIAVLKDGTLVATYSGRMTSNFTDSSGVFVSTNGGASWVDRSNSNMLYWTMDLTVDPGDATQKTWYVGVYSGWGGVANNRGGLFKTTNRGATWTEIWNTYAVGSCAIDPNNPKIMYAATETEGLWVSTNLTSANPTFTQVTAYPFVEPTRIFFNPWKAGEVWVTSFGNGLHVGEQTGP
jgi:photosystem II stability/assembly factor-like uncharacterized protein